MDFSFIFCIEYCGYHTVSCVCCIPKESLQRFPGVNSVTVFNETVIKNILLSTAMTCNQNTFIFLKTGPYKKMSDVLFTEIARYCKAISKPFLKKKRIVKRQYPLHMEGCHVSTLR